MGLNINLTQKQPSVVFDRGITHNLTTMASKCGLYNALWNGNEIAVSAGHLIPILEEGIAKLIVAPEYYKQFNPPNGWGNYENLLEYAEKYLQACRRFPDASIEISK